MAELDLPVEVKNLAIFKDASSRVVQEDVPEGLARIIEA